MRILLSLICCRAMVGPSFGAQKWSRDWKIYVITHTHADIGFTDQIPEVERVRCEGMDQAIIAAGKGLKWTLEGSLSFDVYGLCAWQH